MGLRLKEMEKIGAKGKLAKVSRWFTAGTINAGGLREGRLEGREQ